MEYYDRYLSAAPGNTVAQLNIGALHFLLGDKAVSALDVFRSINSSQ